MVVGFEQLNEEQMGVIDGYSKGYYIHLNHHLRVNYSFHIAKIMNRGKIVRCSNRLSYGLWINKTKYLYLFIVIYIIGIKA